MGALRAGLMMGKLALALELSALVWHLAGGKAALAALRAADPLWLAAAALALTAQTWVCSARWLLTARQLGIRMPAYGALREYYLSQFINQIVPGGVVGDAGRAMRARGHAGLMASGQAVVFERLAGLLAVLAVLALAMLATLWSPGGMVWPAAFVASLPWGFGAVLVVLAAFWAARHHLPTGLRAQGSAFACAIGARAVVRWQLGLSLLAALCNIAGFGFCAWAVGAPLTVPAMLALVPLILLAMVVPLTISGWGLREGAAVALLPLAGITQGDALATSIAFGLVFLAVTLPGALVLTSASARPMMKS